MLYKFIGYVFSRFSFLVSADGRHLLIDWTCHFFFFFWRWENDSGLELCDDWYLLMQETDLQTKTPVMKITTENPHNLRCCWGNSALGSWPRPHPLITMVRALQPVDASPDWKLSTVPGMELLQKQRSGFYANQGFPTASQDRCHVLGTAPLPIQLFFLIVG